MRDLQTAGLGTAYFLRIMNRLGDGELIEPSLLPGWSRRHVLAHVGYNARALARLVQGAAAGKLVPMYTSPEAREQEIQAGSTLSPIALRRLVEHSAIHLDVEWRDLPSIDWDFQIVTAQGRRVPVSETIWMRTREVWVHAVDLDRNGSFADMPLPVLQGLVTDVTAAWQRRGDLAGIRLVSDDLDVGDHTVAEAGALRAPTHELAAWAMGRTGDVLPTWSGGRRAPVWI